MKINLRIVFFRLKACGAGFALFVFVMALSSVSALYAQNGTGVGGAVRAETVGSPEKMTVKGVVVDKETGETMIGVSIRVLGTDVITVTDIDGAYSLTLPKGRYKVVFTYIGYEKLERELDASHTESFKKVVMAPASKTMNEVVVTGIYQRKKESFTGSAATFEGPELKKIGVQNVLQSLKTLDPSFKIADNIQFGSDPNRMPDIEIRGKSSIMGLKEEYGTDPNQPLFILDGFETDLQTVSDLNMNRVASVTILKDAASTAIYGSKAANGVVVIETVKPEKGRLRLSYKGDFSLTKADLTDYNLMNAYDNSIRYTDNFLARIIHLLEEQQVDASMLYTSDHGEDIFDDGRHLFLHASPVPSYYQLHVPFLLWTSDSYREEYPGIEKAASMNRQKNISSSISFFQTMMELAGIETSYRNDSLSVTSPLYTEKSRVYLNDHNEPRPLDDIGMRKEDFEMLKKRGIDAQ